MSYGKIHDKFWTDAKIRSYSDDGKLLALYLLTGPHRNLLGCYRLPLGYIIDDLQWTADRTVVALTELATGDRPFIARDREGWTAIINAVKYELYTSPNHLKSADFLLSRVPSDSPIFPIVSHKLSSVWRDDWVRRPKYLEATPELLFTHSIAPSELLATPAPAPAPAPAPKTVLLDRPLAASRVRASAAFLLPDWKPSSDEIEYASSLGLINGSVEIEATKFRAYWAQGAGQGTRRTPKGWRQSWFNWCGKAINMRGGIRAAPTSPTKWTPETIEAALEESRAKEKQYDHK